jgi:hypothetical protein
VSTFYGYGRNELALEKIKVLVMTGVREKGAEEDIWA